MERPILFSSAMARAILAGTKTQTRRIVMPRPRELVEFMPGSWAIPTATTGSFEPIRHPWTPGDRLWVRETIERNGYFATYRSDRTSVPYRDGCPEGYCGRALWQWPKISTLARIPRWASRITLEVTDVRIERLQEITHEDAIAEGIGEAEKDRAEGWQVRDQPLTVAQLAFSRLWEDIHGKYAWDDNPWVWVIGFRRVEAKTEAAA